MRQAAKPWLAAALLTLSSAALAMDGAAPPDAMGRLRAAAEAGAPEAQYALAQSYLNGALGVTNVGLAEYWLGRFREHGWCPSTLRIPDRW